jgi:hypothetical protein
LSRQAERALQRTAGLRREADRVAALFGNENGLDWETVMSLHQVAARAVFRKVARFDRQRCRARDFGESCSQILRQVRHLFETTQSTVL